MSLPGPGQNGATGFPAFNMDPQFFDQMTTDYMNSFNEASNGTAHHQFNSFAKTANGSTNYQYAPGGDDGTTHSRATLGPEHPGAYNGFNTTDEDIISMWSSAPANFE